MRWQPFFVFKIRTYHQTYLIKNGGYSAKSPRKWRANSIA